MFYIKNINDFSYNRKGFFYLQYPGLILHNSSHISANLMKYFAKFLYIDKPLPLNHLPANWWIKTALNIWITNLSKVLGFSGIKFDKELLNQSLKRYELQKLNLSESLSFTKGESPPNLKGKYPFLLSGTKILNKVWSGFPLIFKFLFFV